MYTQSLTLITTAIKKVSNLVIRDFNEIEFLLQNPQGAKIFTQNLQTKLQESILSDITKFKPNYSFIIPNSKHIKNKDDSNTIIINGILGEDNFSHGIPYFVINVVLQRDNIPFASVMYNPITNELYSVEKNGGAFFNQKKLHISKYSNHESLKIATDSSAIGNNNSLLKENIIISDCPILDLCYLGANKLKKVIFNNPIQNYHIQGGILFLQEIGFKIEKQELESTITTLVV